MNQSGTIQEFIRREVVSIIKRSRRFGYAQLYLIGYLTGCAEALSQVTGGSAELILRGGYDGRIFKSYAAIAEV